MVKANPHYLKMEKGYLFSEIEKRCSALKKQNPEIELLNFGIGDFTKPIPKMIARAISEAALEMGKAETFKGYRSAQGELFLREKIKAFDYPDLPITADEIFISDGIKGAIGNMAELFYSRAKVAISDPAYPVYIDSNALLGRFPKASKDPNNNNHEKANPQLIFLSCREENLFTPSLPEEHVDLIYLCSPNNPTGQAYTKAELKKFVDFAIEKKAILLFDGAYEAYITDPDIPHSIYEIEGAEKIAIEFRSYSKNVGFTGIRLSYTVIPKALKTEEGVSVLELWKRRIETKYGAASYPLQKGALAIYTEDGQAAIQANIQAFLENGKLLRKGLEKLGFTVYGGKNSPFVWCKVPQGFSAWEFFNHLLEKAHLITIPGSGFGECGEGFVRFSAFAKKELIEKGLKRLSSNLALSYLS